jgi:hypothetical protein
MAARLAGAGGKGIGVAQQLKKEKAARQAGRLSGFGAVM